MAFPGKTPLQEGLVDLDCVQYNCVMSKTSPLSKATAAEMLSLDHQLCFALYSASLAMTKMYKPLLEPLGLTYPQYLAMRVLWESDGLAVSELGQRLQLDSGTLTPLLKRLEASGWLVRQRDSADERRVLLKLTPAGRALKARAARIPPHVLCASGCSLDELTALTRRIKELRDQLQSFPPADAA
jgi:DNA-binding MarR family transcriptional regulator